MTVHVALGPVVSIIAGVLILLIPRLLNYIVAVYLIVIGILGLMHRGAGLAQSVGVENDTRYSRPAISENVQSPTATLAGDLGCKQPIVRGPGDRSVRGESI